MPKLKDEFKSLESSDGWNVLFSEIRSESSRFKCVNRDARKTENKCLNRYRDVTPFDHSRVKLLRGHTDYVNASLVQVPDAGRRYILTQGPLPETVTHFWLMIWEQRSVGVVMLNKIIERGQIKCHQYWPSPQTTTWASSSPSAFPTNTTDPADGSGRDSQNSNEAEKATTPPPPPPPTLDLDEVGLKLEYLGECSYTNYLVRDFRLTDTKSGESREVKQFHYVAWPDFGLPESPSCFLDFLSLVRASGSLSPDVGPIVVHCSAGIGRSGTFCLVDSCLVLIELKHSTSAVNVKALLLEMRKSRMGLIQTPEQLRFSYQAILEGCEKLAELDLAESEVPPEEQYPLKKQQIPSAGSMNPSVLAKGASSGSQQNTMSGTASVSSSGNGQSISDESDTSSRDDQQNGDEQPGSSDLPSSPSSGSSRISEEDESDELLENEDEEVGNHPRKTALGMRISNGSSKSKGSPGRPASLLAQRNTLPPLPARALKRSVSSSATTGSASGRSSEATPPDSATHPVPSRPAGGNPAFVYQRTVSADSAPQLSINANYSAQNPISSNSHLISSKRGKTASEREGDGRDEEEDESGNQPSSEEPSLRSKLDSAHIPTSVLHPLHRETPGKSFTQSPNCSTAGESLIVRRRVNHAAANLPSAHTLPRGSETGGGSGTETTRRGERSSQREERNRVLQARVESIKENMRRVESREAAKRRLLSVATSPVSLAVVGVASLIGVGYFFYSRAI